MKFNELMRNDRTSRRIEEMEEIPRKECMGWRTKEGTPSSNICYLVGPYIEWHEFAGQLAP